jgi:hypothetical protein
MALRSGVGIIQDLDEEKGKKTVTRKVRGSDINTTTVGKTEVGGLTSAIAGIPSGLVKTVEGVVSLGAELMDLGAGQMLNLPSTKGSTVSAAQDVEEFFDKLNVFEETAEARATGKLTQALVQIGVPGTAGAKGMTVLANQLAKKAIKAKKNGKYANIMSKNAQKGIKKAEELNKLTGKQRFGAIVLGGAAGETLVGDTEDIGTFGDLFEAGPTQLDRDERENPKDDAARKLMNRFKFGSESLLITPFVYGVGTGAKMLAKQGKELAYSSSKIARGLDKFGAIFRPRSSKPEEVFLSKMKENARKMADTNFSMEQVARIDKVTNKYFPATKSFLDRTSDTGRKQFLEDLDKTLFKGDLNKEGLDRTLKSNLLKQMNAVKVPVQDQSIIFKGLTDTRQKFKELLEITAGGPGAKVDLPAGVAIDLRALMGDRIKNYIGTTYELFQNREAGLFNKFKPAKQDKDFVANMFMRYAAKNKNPITKLEADDMVDEVMNSARNMDPKKDTLPTFAYQNLTRSADDAYNIKTFAQTLERETAAGDKTLQVLGKGSKAFRKLFGEVDDVRHSIFEGVNRLSVVARKNQMFDEILEVDDAMKAATKSDTPAGQRGFFHSTPLEAKRAFGDIPNSEIVKIDPYVKDYFKDGVLVNRLQGTYTTKAIAEGFDNVSKLQEFMRGDTGGALGKTFSWAWRNLLLTPKAGAQYAKTILSIPTHIRNFLSSGAFSLGNGILFENPQLVKEAMARAGATVQMGIRNPLSMERYRRYLELGVTNTNTRLGDLRNLMKDVRFGEGNIATDSVLKPMLNSLGALGKGVKKGAKFMQDAYVAEDDFWKIVNFEVEYGRIFNINKSKSLKLSKEIMEERAAKIVRNTVPNYAYVGELVRAARMSPFGNFMSWPSEVYRTGTGIVQQALEEIADPITKKINPITSTNPMKGVGMKRLIGMTAVTAALPYGAIKGSQAIFGVSNEEADAANDFVAPWAKDSQKIYFRDPETNELYYTDYSKNNVYDTLTRPFQTILRNIQEGMEDEEPLIKGFVQGIAEAAGNVAEPFVSESMFTEAFMDIYSRNGMTNEGVELYSEQTPDVEKVQRIFKHLGKTLMPTTKPFERLGKAITKTPGSTGEMFEVTPEIAGIMGWKPVKVDPERALGFYIYDFQRGISKARKEFTGGPEGLLKGGPKTPQAVIERLFVANQASFNVQKEMLRHFQNAQKIGMSRSRITKSLEKRGIPESTIDDLFKGKFKFFFPSEAIQDRFKEISREGGMPNPFLQSKGILNGMRNAFKGISLYRDFPLTLEDFMPPSDTYDDQSSLPTPPLGATPMPSKQLSQAPNVDPITRLTSTETALLSPTEKVIASRT